MKTMHEMKLLLNAGENNQLDMKALQTCHSAICSKSVVTIILQRFGKLTISVC